MGPNLLKLSVAVGFGRGRRVCGRRVREMDLQRVCVFIFLVWFLDMECMKGLCVSSGWDVLRLRRA